ncbi:hypothetical protein SBRY_110232 [Actinacidiphila bryophytorum]|uniref:Uncharacterized protein n=1 Tax=Actinacidiphila bryophytorum TaxID=1436133 RepID=A0A9W4E4H2_9ACTN|nr:hypothetical protein SBRY_110232 [Actinacidiphila bryophytorum]
MPQWLGTSATPVACVPIHCRPYNGRHGT